MSVNLIHMGDACATEAAARVVGKSWLAECDAASSVVVKYLDVEGWERLTLVVRITDEMVSIACDQFYYYAPRDPLDPNEFGPAMRVALEAALNQ